MSKLHTLMKQLDESTVPTSPPAGEITEQNKASSGNVLIAELTVYVEQHSRHSFSTYLFIGKSLMQLIIIHLDV